MKKTIFVCGLIAGVISCLWWAVGEPTIGESVSYNMRVVYGYAAMFLAFSLIFVGVKSYRDEYNGGTISFGKSLKIALLIALIASTVYTAAWLINYYFFIPDFGDKLMASSKAEMLAKGTSAAEVEQQMAGMKEFLDQYKNPFYNAMMTYAEIVPVGILVSIIASLILRKDVKPASVND
ncbi:DUF4199 domain-containing protein [Pedobacter sp. PWIIR3]